MLKLLEKSVVLTFLTAALYFFGVRLYSSLYGLLGIPIEQLDVSFAEALDSGFRAIVFFPAVFREAYERSSLVLSLFCLATLPSAFGLLALMSTRIDSRLQRVLLHFRIRSSVFHGYCILAAFALFTESATINGFNDGFDLIGRKHFNAAVYVEGASEPIKASFAAMGKSLYVFVLPTGRLMHVPSSRLIRIEIGEQPVNALPPTPPS